VAIQRALEIDRRRLNEVLRVARAGPLPGLLIQDHAEALRLVTHPSTAAAIARFAAVPAIRLSGAALETLAVIAYSQPATRADVTAARGVNSDGPISTLLSHGLIAESGRSDGPGRPSLFVTTTDFLNLLGLPSIDELPAIPSDSGPV
jgi:segregation and condensation protein B